ncbi:hypothetical protein DL765_010539 [Monosporascus sp. GIB2]|nr:hypothetical protein DL765_010539 [Monosporascus sp. GIB2]
MISEVVYLHENTEIEALLLRKGIQAIDSDELLQIVDLTLSSSSSMGNHHAHDTLAAAHLLTATLRPVNLNRVPIIHDDDGDGADDLDRLGEVQEDAYDGSDDAAGEDVSDDSGPHEMHTP